MAKLRPGSRLASEDGQSIHGRTGKLRSSAHLRQLLKAGLVPAERLKTLDMDRLQEEEEDFTAADRDRLALDPEKLKPLPLGRRGGGVVLRTIVGEPSLFAQGRQLVDGKKPDQRSFTTQAFYPSTRRVGQ